MWLLLSTLVVLTRLLPTVNGLVPPTDLLTSKHMRVVVIPDTHGDYLATLRSLHLAYTLIEGTRATVVFSEFTEIFNKILTIQQFPEKPITTSPKRSVLLVQLGDLVDRGPDSTACVEVFRHLETVLGWTVRVLYGNHEILSMIGWSTPYIHRRELDLVGDRAVRDFLYAPGGSLHKKIRDMSVGMVKLTARPGLGAEVPLNHPRNPNTLFVHAGIDMRWFMGEREFKSFPGVNEMFWILAATKAGLNQLNMPNSPLWTRHLSSGLRRFVCGDYLEKILKHFNVARIIVGHSPLDEMKVKERCDGRIILTDVKMSRWMFPAVDELSQAGGRPVAVIMRMGEDGLLDSIIAHYTDLKTGKEHEHTVIFPPGIGHQVGTTYDPDIRSVVPTWRELAVRTWQDRYNSSYRYTGAAPLAILTTTTNPISDTTTITECLIPDVGPVTSHPSAGLDDVQETGLVPEPAVEDLILEWKNSRIRTLSEQYSASPDVGSATPVTTLMVAEPVSALTENTSLIAQTPVPLPFETTDEATTTNDKQPLVPGWKPLQVGPLVEEYNASVVAGSDSSEVDASVTASHPPVSTSPEPTSDTRTRPRERIPCAGRIYWIEAVEIPPRRSHDDSVDYDGCITS